MTPRTWSLIHEAIATGQPIEGHGGFSGSRLAAYAAAGVQSTHSPNTPEQALEMLRAGFTIQLKAEREADTIKKLLKSQVDWSRIGLAVDDRPVESCWNSAASTTKSGWLSNLASLPLRHIRWQP